MQPSTRHPWMDEASCAEIGGDLWFTDNTNDPAAKRAKEVCARCPVQSECLEHALATDQRYGIWGGMTQYERRSLKRARRA